jgi:hypothetical protein
VKRKVMVPLGRWCVTGFSSGPAVGRRLHTAAACAHENPTRS